MEGITGYIYRNVHHRHFPEIDRYYMPFISAHVSQSMKHKEKEDIRSLTSEIKELRHELKVCREVQERSEHVRENLEIIDRDRTKERERS